VTEEILAMVLSHDKADYWDKHAPLKIPKNVTLKNCKLIFGKIKFEHGDLTAVGKGAIAIACGGNAKAIASAEDAKARAEEGATSEANVSGAYATAGSGSTSWANAEGAHASAGGGAIAYANAFGASASASGLEKNWEPSLYAKACALTAGAYAFAGEIGKAYAEVPGSIAVMADDWGTEACAALINGGSVITYKEYCQILDNFNILENVTYSALNRASAAFDIGMKYYKGNTVHQSDSLGVIFLTRAYELGHPAAAFELGNSYMARRGLRKDVDEAMRWYKTAARQGHLGAGLAIETLNKPNPMFAWLLPSSEAAPSHLAHYDEL
jgi:TPR repeat protein